MPIADTGAELELLHVAQSALGDGVGQMNEAAAAPIVAELKDQLEQLSPPHTDVRCSRHVQAGDPSTIIEEFARDRDADLIFMTTHGRTGLKRALMGSVAEKVVRQAACPVVTARLSLLEEGSERCEDYAATKAANS